MTQPFADKLAAIRSLLELVYWHLDYIPGAMRVQRYGESEQEPPEHRVFLPVNVDCNGRCYTCLAYYRLIGRRPDCPPEEKWERERADLRRRYRIADVEASLMRLADVDVTLAQAVWAVYVEPWPGALWDATRPAMGAKTEAISLTVREERARLAEEGVRWLGHDIRGDVLAYGEKPDPIDNQIRQLAAHGYTWKRIRRELGVSNDRISRVLAVKETAVGV